MIALSLAVLLASAASAGERERLLRDGDWNQRIHAATSLGALGPDALPLLAYAARDADWQVRMTAAHEMGRIGLPALGALEAVLREEPCRHVRLTAVHWLGSMGPPASSALRRALDDESAMVRLTGRYWLDKDPSKGAAPAPPDAAAAKREDLKSCSRSDAPGRAPWAAAAPDPAAAPEEAPVAETIVTKDPIPRTPPRPAKIEPAAQRAAEIDQARLEELDDVLAPPGKPEAMPATPELMPMSSPGFGDRSAPETSGAEIAADAGTGKMANDPLPALLVYLKDADPAKRARAADELGRRGTPAAVAALTLRLNDRVPRVRASAALALGNIGSAADASVPALVAALKKGPEEVAWSIALALGRIGTPRARKAFERSQRRKPSE